MKNTDINNFLTAIYPSTDYGIIDLTYSGGNLKDNINLSQYDIVYVDYNNGTDDIRRNAKLFEEAINWVNAHKTSGQPNVVMGLSMGGLVARYALRTMEVAGKDHQTWKFISVDAPHKGANVPVSVQAMVRHLQELDLRVFFIKVLSAADIFSDLKGAVNLLNSKAAKQMLIYQVTKDLTYDNSEYTAFMQEYDALGFPQQCQNIAIADGSGQASMVFAPERELIKMNESYTLKGWLGAVNAIFGGLSGVALLTNYPQLIINVIPGNTQLNATSFANALPNKKNSKIYEGRVFIKKKLLFLISVNVNIAQKSMNSASDMLPIDGAPGGLYNINTMMELSDKMAQYVQQPQFCFVPTVSALALSNWKDKLTVNLQNEDFFATGASGFDQYFTSSANELHTRLNFSASFLYTHLTCPLFYFNPNVSSFCGTSSSVVKNPSNYSLTWSVSSGFTIKTSDNTSATIVSPVNTQVGILTCKYNNTTTVRKRLSSTCNFNPVISGPTFICSSGSGTTYSVTGFPSNALIDWYCSSNITLVSASGNSVVFRANGNTGGNAWIRAEFSGISVTRDNLVISQFTSPEFHPNTSVALNSSTTLQPQTSGISSYRWNVGPPSGAASDSYGASLTIKFSQTGTYSIFAYGINDCGESTTPTHVYIFTASSPSHISYAVYPNPVSDLLNIEQEENLQQSELMTGTEIAAPKSVSVSASFDVRLYDVLGQLRQSTLSKNKNITLNVSGLPSGNYYLHIYDGVSETPEIRQIIIQH